MALTRGHEWLWLGRAVILFTLLSVAFIICSVVEGVIVHVHETVM